MSSSDPIFDALRRANPVPPESLDARGVPSPELFEEITMTAPDSIGPSTRRWPLLAAAAALVLALAVGAALTSRDSSNERADTTTIPTTEPASTGQPTVTMPVAPGGTGPISPGMGSCIEVYSLETLANREVAFDGTVTSVDADEVTFDVNVWYQGGEGPTVTLDSNGLAGTAITSGGGDVQLVVGQRFLVAGDGGFVWACGFTQPYDEAVAASWADTFTD